MSAVAKHTPGPWRIGYRNLNVVSENEKIGGDAVVCDIRGWGYLTGNGHGAMGLDPQDAAAIQEANARLIAAAPDMLEALKVISGMNIHHDVLSAVEAAIAKAGGRS